MSPNSKSGDASQTVSIAGRLLRLTHPQKILYPATGTTKAEVLTYYVTVAPLLLPHIAGRIVTRKRWVDGVGTPEQPGEVFFEKNLPGSAPSWIRRVDIQHKSHTTTYPLFSDVAALAWAGQVCALELHVPQWRVDRSGTPLNPDRLVLDLDPGPGAGLPECVEVALRARSLLSELGLEAFPVTSGSKGLHLYAGLDGSYDAEYINRFAKQLAQALESELPALVVSNMSKSLRTGKVLVDWSQNNASKTTIAPYSMRGTFQPMVAVPRSWDELGQGLQQLSLDDVLARVETRDDPMLALAGERPEDDKLATYRSMRDAAKTPEPVPERIAPVKGGMSFVIHEHHARRLHWDLRFERDGVLVSWALPKGVPTDPTKNHLAVQTEDHPLEYGAFEGTIPRGEYGAGEVRIWDAGTYELEKWRDGKEVIATLTGRPDGGLGGPRRIALINTGKNWLIHLMKSGPDAKPTAHPSGSGFIAPMLATSGDASQIGRDDDWAYELKWDGVRVVAVLNREDVTLFSRTGKNVTATYPEVVRGLAELNLADTVLDGEVVAFDADGAPSFSRLQARMGRTAKTDVRAAAKDVAATYLVFDVLRSQGRDQVENQYVDRRALVERLKISSTAVRTPDVCEGTIDQAVKASQRLNLEGVVAKRRNSRYVSGKRSPYWIKIKNQRMQEVVIGGWRPGKGGRADSFGSLLLGVPDGSALRYVGRVGTGFNDRSLTRLASFLTDSESETSPFEVVPADVERDARWVIPKLVGEVSFVEWTDQGILRQPTWRGLRADKEPADVTVE